MRKTTVIAALAAGFVGWSGADGVARAQTPEPSAPEQPDAPEPGAPAGDELEPAPTPPPSDEAPAEPPAGAPLDNSLFPSPALDARGLQQQGEQRPDARRETGTVALEDLFAEDWWSHARPIFEFHGYFRTRAQLFYN